MFDPKVTFPLKSLWDKLGTFYTRMTPEGKKVVEKYWDALFRGMEGLYYDLYQTNLSSYLETSPGYLEHAYQNHHIIFEGNSKNCQLLPHISGSYYFDLPDEGIYLSIPTLSGLTTGQVLAEGVDYEIHNFNQIKFKRKLHSSAPGTGTTRMNISMNTPFDTSDNAIKTNSNNLPHSISEKFLAKTAITLVPSLTNFIIPAFGRDEPQILLESGYYEPYASGWRSDDISYFEKRKKWAKHLTKWAQAMVACFAKPPTLTNLEQSYSLVRGFPFAHRGGVVEKIEQGVGKNNQWDYVTITVDENTTAYIALGASWATQLITRVQGNFFRIYSKGLPPYTNTAASSQAKEASHDFWLSLNPRQAPEPAALLEGNVGVHTNGVPFVAIPNKQQLLTQNTGKEGWIRNHMYGGMSTALGVDSYNGLIDDNSQYAYVGVPTSTYTESSTTHSPLIGYALDGFPIYGKYGYTNSDGSGGVTEMTSSYKLITSHLRPHVLHDGGGAPHNGYYRNDFVYEKGHGYLDEHNGRYAATPEYPEGIYHYHVTDSFPYMMNGFTGAPSYNSSQLPTLGVTTLEKAVKDVYEIPTGGDYLINEGQPLEKFDILLSGIQFIDYITSPGTVDSIVTASGTQQTFDVSVGVDYEFQKGFVIGGLSDYVRYTGSYMQDADVNYIDILADVWPYTDNHEKLSNSGIDQNNNLLLSGDPGNYDPALPTWDSVFQSFAGNSIIDPSIEGTYEGTDVISGQTYTTERPTAVPQRGNTGVKGEGNTGGNTTY